MGVISLYMIQMEKNIQQLELPCKKSKISSEDKNDKSSAEEKKALKRVTFNDLQELLNNIQRMENKNAKIYMKIKKENPEFYIKLYKHKCRIRTAKDQISLTEQLMLRELDKLHDQQRVLERQWHKLQFQQQSYKENKDVEVQKITRHYAFLREIWKKPDHATNSHEKLERLNQMVGFIKGNIASITKHEEDNYHNQQYNCQKVTQSHQYVQIKQKYEALLMRIGQIQSSNHRNRQVGQQQSNQLLQEQNSMLRQTNKELRVKLRQLEEKYIKMQDKINQLNEQIHHKDKQIEIMKKNSKQQPQRIYKYKGEQRCTFEVRIISDTFSQLQTLHIGRSLSQITQFLQSETDQDPKKYYQVRTPSLESSKLSKSNSGVKPKLDLLLGGKTMRNIKDFDMTEKFIRTYGHSQNTIKINMSYQAPPPF